MFYRKDRNTFGGGVLIAANSTLLPQEIKLASCNSELLFVRIKACIIICCYYRLPQCNNIDNFIETLALVVQRYPKDMIILIGDMNFPGFDWQRNIIKSNTPFKSLQQFQSFLVEHDMTQLIELPTHIKGNILDLVCTNNAPSILTQIITPGISDHFIIDVQIHHCHPNSQSKPKAYKMYHKADVNLF
ncbi:hypothetical protein EB796_000877 [Bugula neritina]|uniref:Endonuclease/exonuclease/phosphatase domain-containing protein n=1 Tax=Bugula neritina TaxID=10212 RepID=A0A7J7KRJ8_BUGNE|nr:hypothetical protein EB796_000877 [Bugula neritina]